MAMPTAWELSGLICVEKIFIRLRILFQYIKNDEKSESRAGGYPVFEHPMLRSDESEKRSRDPKKALPQETASFSLFIAPKSRN